MCHEDEHCTIEFSVIAYTGSRILKIKIAKKFFVGQSSILMKWQLG